ncbi:MAG: GNAT family N-acetyltransferase [Lachnospiraceae bacterium]
MKTQENVTIRKWKIEDAKSLAEVLSNKNIMNNLRDGLPFPYTEKDALSYILAMLEADPDSTFAYAIDIDGIAVGSIGAFRQENIHSRTAELGYYLSEQYWGKGVMTRAVSLLCEKIFEETDILRIYAEPFEYNTGSRRVLEKAGFQFEGIMENNAVKNGMVLSMALYAMTRQPEPYYVRRLNADEIKIATDLIWEVFLQFEAPEYSKEGIDFFRGSLDDEERNRKLKYYGAFEGKELIGTLCMREPQHIGGFFVKAQHQQKGVGRALFEAMRKDYEKQEFTVHSSPYGVKIYECLGFQATDEEQLVNGLRFTPMVFKNE